MKTIAIEAQECAHDLKMLYGLVCKLAGVSSKPLQGIDDEEGNPVIEQNKVKVCWRQLFAKLFSASIIPDPRAHDYFPEVLPPG